MQENEKGSKIIPAIIGQFGIYQLIIHIREYDNSRHEQWVVNCKGRGAPKPATELRVISADTLNFRFE